MGTCIHCSNDEQGDLFYSVGPHRNQCQPQLTQEIPGRGFGKMQVNGPGQYNLARKKSLAVGIAYMAVYLY